MKKDGAVTQITHPVAGASYGDTFPFVSPDGKTLVFVRQIHWARNQVMLRDLATGAERTEFSSLAQRRPHWLSAAECNFVAASDEAERAARDRDRRRQQFERAAAVFFFALAVGATIAGVWAYRAQEEATQAQAIVALTGGSLAQRVPVR